MQPHDSHHPPSSATGWDREPEWSACPLPELAALRRWVTWRLERRDGKVTKVPYAPKTGRHASTTDAASWTDYQTVSALTTARQAQARYGHDGVGVVFSAEDDLVGVDLDRCRGPETDAIEPWARAIVDRLGSYSEASPSGAGVHVLVRGDLPRGGRRKGRIEVYDHSRFFTVTGEHLPGTPDTIEERTSELVALHAEVYIEARQQAGRKNSTIKNELAILRRAFRLAAEDGRVAVIPKFPMPEVDNARQGFFEANEYRAVLAELPAQLRPLIIAIYYTGWRTGELLGLEWSQVDFEAGILRLEVRTTKNNKGREFPFTALPELAEMLLERGGPEKRRRPAGGSTARRGDRARSGR
jgi:Phage integrase family